MSTTRPVTSADYTHLGQSVPHNELLEETTRLVERATKDKAQLADEEWTDADTGVLETFANELRLRGVEKTTAQGAKQSATSSAGSALKKAKTTYRRGLGVASRSIKRRGDHPPAGESEEETATHVAECVRGLDAIDVTIGRDAAKLFAAMGALAVFLARPDLAPAPGTEPVRAKLIAALKTDADALPQVSGTKAETVIGAKEATMSAIEIRGRLYDKLRGLAKAGRDAHRYTNPSVSAEYQLNALHAAINKVVAEKQGEVKPPPAV